MAALVTAAAVAGASWSAQSNGAARAQAGRLQPVAATPATPASQLYPGTSADSALTLTNPNPVAMTVTSIVSNGAVTSDTEGCGGDSVSFTNQTGAWEVAKNAQLTLRLPNSVAMALDADDACQGASFTIPVAVTASVSGQGGSADTTTTTTSTTAPSAELAWTPSNYTYPSTELGATSPAQTVTLRNMGSASAPVETAVNAADFIVDTNTCAGTTLAPSQTCTLQVRFRPLGSATGTRTGTVQARPVGSSAWTTATLSGTAAPPANLIISPSSYAFPNTAVATQSPSSTFGVTNTGGAEARNVNFGLQGADASSFVITGSSCGAVVAPGQQCQISVAFRPNRTGSQTTQLRVSWSTATATNAAYANISGQGV